MKLFLFVSAISHDYHLPFFAPVFAPILRQCAGSFSKMVQNV
jgi:hypothetical protein